MIVFWINKVFRKNTKARKRFFVCLTGMPGAGKSSVADSLKERGFYVISMGDVVPRRGQITKYGAHRYQLGRSNVKTKKGNGTGRHISSY